MRRALRQRRHLLILCAGVILVVSVGVAYAAIPHSQTGLISGCYEKITGVVRVIDAQAGKRCLSFETAISWNQQGLKGDKGDPGAQGLKGDPGAQGVKGDPGEKGDKGDPGAKGDKGDPGADGAAGATGATGAAGAAGPAGPQGPPGSTTFAGSVCSPNGLFCLEIKNEGVFIKRAGHKVLKVTLSDVELEE